MAVSLNQEERHTILLMGVILPWLVCMSLIPYREWTVLEYFICSLFQLKPSDNVLSLQQHVTSWYNTASSRVSSRTASYVCEQCNNKTFTNRNRYLEHLTKHTGLYYFKCQGQCGQSFRTHFKFKSHKCSGVQGTGNSMLNSGTM